MSDSIAIRLRHFEVARAVHPKVQSRHVGELLTSQVGDDRPTTRTRTDHNQALVLQDPERLA
jgi:hypothetical protein